MNAKAAPGLSRMSKAIFTPFAFSSARTAGSVLDFEAEVLDSVRAEVL